MQGSWQPNAWHTLQLQMCPSRWRHSCPDANHDCIPQCSCHRLSFPQLLVQDLDCSDSHHTLIDFPERFNDGRTSCVAHMRNARYFYLPTLVTKPLPSAMLDGHYMHLLK